MAAVPVAAALNVGHDDSGRSDSFVLSSGWCVCNDALLCDVWMVPFVVWLGEEADVLAGVYVSEYDGDASWDGSVCVCVCV